ncbi:pyridoxal phosphate-dependent aminotransferase [Ekhidna sp. To15]|uniref:pyridoxal phosphate-dependent aminotransferase n=1 Tax=Ekhidna sp. To15 TaxID=3395267 RepID=UPI003F522006
MSTTIKRREWIKLSALASGAGFGILNGLDVFGKTSPKVLSHIQGDESVRRLLFNENPLGPSEKVTQIIQEQLPRASKYATFHSYDFMALKELIAEQEGLKPENVLLSHGSFESLIMISSHFGANVGEIIVPSPSFDVVGNFGRKIGAKVRPIEVDEQFRMNLPAMKSAVTSKTKLVTICNPNNPTGTSCNPDDLRSFCSSIANKAHLLIDEAYIHYLNSWRSHTMAPLIKEGKNVLITRTFSKVYGMAGLRIGYMLGPEEFVRSMEAKYTLGFPGNMPNSLSVAAAIESLKDDSFIARSRTFNEKSKMAFYKSLDQLGIPYIKSDANFVFYDVQKFNEYKSLMWGNKILLTGGWPSKSNWARVTIGSDDDMQFLVEKMQGKKWL